MGVGDDRRWVDVTGSRPTACCGASAYSVNGGSWRCCECAFPVDEVVEPYVPAAVVDGLRGEVERLRRGVSDLAIEVAYTEVVEKPEAEVEIARLSGEVERLRTALARRVPAEVPMWETGGQTTVWVENHEDAADRELLAGHGLRPLGGVNRGHRERIAAAAPVVSLEQEDN